MIKLRDLVDIKIIEETVGSIRKRKDLLLELTFVDTFSDAAVKCTQSITINVDDKDAHEIVFLVRKYKNMEEMGPIWAKSNIMYTNTADQQVSTEIYLDAPFFDY
jgi:hypothetical protein